MNGDEMVVWIGRTYIASQLRQDVFLCLRILFLGFGKVVRHRTFARETPDNLICTPSGDQIPPMLLDFGHPHTGNKVSPKANHTGCEPVIRKVLNADVS